MKLNRSLFTIPFVAILSSCAIHPLPEDVTGVTTYDIVRQIRCETREAAKQLVLEKIRDLAEHSPDSRAVSVSQNLLARFDTEVDNIDEFDPKKAYVGSDFA